MCTGSTHDSVAFSASGLERRLRETGMYPGFCIADDPVYLSQDCIVTLCSKIALRSEPGVYGDSFNY